MAIVLCPNCQSRFEFSAGAEVDELGESFSIKVPCASCDAWLRIPECDIIQPPNAPADILEAMKGQSKPVAEDDDRPTDFSVAKKSSSGGAAVTSGAEIHSSFVRKEAKPWWKFW